MREEKKEAYKLIDSAEVIKVVQDMVSIPSINPPGDEAAVANYIIAYMESHGIATTVFEISAGRYNVVARLKGLGVASPIIFSGHMDVVPVSEDERKRWKTDPFVGEVIDGYIYGRGSADMKGGLGAAMVAMGTLAKHKIQPPGDIILAATVDEEDLMRGAKGLVTSNLISDASRFVICEPTNMTLNIACKGRTWAEVTVKGQTAHASVKGAGINAIDRAVTLINHMRTHVLLHQEHEMLGDSFWQVNLINGGIEPAIVPDACTITVDARLVPGQKSQDVWNELEKIIASIKETIPDFDAEINVIEAREPWGISRDDYLVQTLDKIFQQLNMTLEYTGFVGTTDGTIFRRANIHGVIIGPGELANNVHQENERVGIEQLVKAAQIYLNTMLFWEN